jgi:regulator of replication initiation timing
MEPKTQEELVHQIAELEHQIASVEREIYSLKAHVSRLLNPDYPNYTDEEIEAMCNEARRIEESLKQK